MAIQKLVLEAIDDEYELIAIHCSLAAYRIAYELNKNLDLHLYRKKEDLNFKYGTISADYPLFEYHDHFQYNIYSLLGNKFKVRIKPDTTEGGLFASLEKNIYVTKYLIPELKNVDYFLKIETETSQSLGKSLAKRLLTISQIQTCYVLDYMQLKSKNNLIFE